MWCWLFASYLTAQSPGALFKAAKFEEAEKAYAVALAANPRDAVAALRLGQLALFSNRLDEADKRLRQAMEMDSELSSAKALLAEVFYRRGNFQEAARLRRAIGNETLARKLAQFKSAQAKSVIEKDALIRQ